MADTHSAPEVRIAALEFLLAHLIASTLSTADLEADLDELRRIEQEGSAQALLFKYRPAVARDILFSAISLLEDAVFQQGK
jgi:hypothetical protein